MSSRRPSQRDRVLNALMAARGGEVSCYELNRCSIQYSSRLTELRKLGYRIISRVERVDGQVHGYFRLDLASIAEARKTPQKLRDLARKSSPIAKPTTQPKQAEPSLFGDLAPLPKYPD